MLNRWTCTGWRFLSAKTCLGSPFFVRIYQFLNNSSSSLEENDVFLGVFFGSLHQFFYTRSKGKNFGSLLNNVEDFL